MTSGVVSLCVGCRNYRGGTTPRCTAFPDGIPVQIWTGGADHRQPIEGDHGIQYELRPGYESLLARFAIALDRRESA